MAILGHYPRRFDHYQKSPHGSALYLTWPLYGGDFPWLLHGHCYAGLCSHFTCTSEHTCKQKGKLSRTRALIPEAAVRL